MGSAPAVRERGILFQGHLIGPIQRDEKTVTRRTQGLDTLNTNPDQWTLLDRSEWPCADLPPEYFVFHRPVSPDEVDGKGDLPSGIVAIKCPYGIPGDRLWVRETFSVFSVTDHSQGIILPPSALAGVGYRADHTTGNLADGDGGYNFRLIEGERPIAQAEKLATERYYEWVPSLFMPRWASRITLEIVNVRPERVQDITEDDARREGVEPAIAGQDEHGPIKTYRTGFVRTWNKINAKRGHGWDRNDWVWRIAFKRI